VKPGTRALGVAESYVGRPADGGSTSPRSTLGGAVVRADRVVDGVVFSSCTVGGRDATASVCRLVDRLGRDDVRYVLLSGVAPAWFNLVDVAAVADCADRPTLAVSFEDSEGLEDALREQFDGDDLAWRLEAYRDLPARVRVDVGEESVFVRAVGLDDETARAVVRAYTPEGGRPEPVRIARLAARAGREYADGATV
jgi:hypothetical protein